MTIVQIKESDVIKNICNDVPVFRLKVDDCHICNLQDKSIKTIKRDMQNDVQYLYFILVKGE